MADGILNKTMDNSLKGVDPSINISAGLPANDNEGQAAMQRALETRSGDIFRGAILGAGAGSQAGANALNPVSAFLQGAAAGLQAPARIYEEKKKQAQGIMESMPFGAVVPEAKNIPGLQNFIGLPYGLVAPAIQEIAKQSVKAYTEGEETRKTAKNQLELDEIKSSFSGKSPQNLKDKFDVSAKFNSLPQVSDFESSRPAYESAAGAPGNAAGDKTLLINYARLLSPTFRGNEGTMSAVDVSGIFDKATLGLWNKAVKGEDLQPHERTMIKREATRIYNTKERAYRDRLNFWREQAVEEGFDPTVIGKKYGTPKPMKTKTGEVVYVVDSGDGSFIEVGGE